MWMSPLHLAGLPAVKRHPMFWVCSFVQQQNANQSMQDCIMAYLDLQVSEQCLLRISSTCLLDRSMCNDLTLHSVQCRCVLEGNGCSLS